MKIRTAQAADGPQPASQLLAEAFGFAQALFGARR